MTVAELIEQLQRMPQEAVVIVGAGPNFDYDSVVANEVRSEYHLDCGPEVWIVG